MGRVSERGQEPRSQAAFWRAPSSWRSLSTRIGIGLLLGTLLFALVSLAQHLDRIDADLLGPTPQWASVVWFGLVILAGLGLYLALSDAAYDPHIRPGYRRMLRGLTLILGLVTAWAFYLSWTSPVTDPANTSESLSLLRGCLLVFLLAGAALQWEPDPPVRGRWMRSLAGATAGVLVAGLIAALVGPLSHPLVVRTVVEGDLGTPAGVPTKITEVGWTWEVPQGTRFQEAIAGVHGPIMVLGDGLVALDGTSGEELWTRRYPNSTKVRPQIMPDGTLAYLTYGRGSGEAALWRVATLDTATGETVREHQEEQTDFWVLRTPEVDLRPRRFDDGLTEVVARAAGTDDELWTFAPREEGKVCHFSTAPREYGGGSPYLLHEDRFVLASLCRVWPDEEESAETETGQSEDRRATETVVVTALDLESGEELWRREEPSGEMSSLPTLYFQAPETSAGGGEPGARVRRIGQEEPLFSLTDGEPIDASPEPTEGQGITLHLHDGTDRTFKVTEGTDILSPQRLDAVAPSGEVTDTVIVDEPAVWIEDFHRAVLLEDTLLLSYRDKTRGGGPVLSLPLPDREGTPIWIGGAPPEEINLESRKHHLVPVPGAVVSYGFEDDGVTQVRGLVP